MICRLSSEASTAHIASFSLEGLEERRFLSAGHSVASHAHHPHPTPAAHHVRHDLKHKVTATPAAKAVAKAHKHHGKALAKGHTKTKKNDHPTGTPGGTGTIPRTEARAGPSSGPADELIAERVYDGLPDQADVI